MPRLTPILHWSQLTRLGVPSFSVSRRPMTTLGQEIGIGEVLPAAIFSPNRLRALYEARLISPVPAASGSTGSIDVVQACRELDKYSTVEIVSNATISVGEVPFNAPSVPVVEEHEHSSQSQAKATYRPSRGVRRS